MGFCLDFSVTKIPCLDWTEKEVPLDDFFCSPACDEFSVDYIYRLKKFFLALFKRMS